MKNQRKKGKGNYQNTKRQVKKSEVISADKRTKKQKGVGIFFLKLGLFICIVSIAIVYSDQKGYFNPDLRNNHTIKKWDTFYKFSKRNNVDVLLMGNSHLYTGINPKNLSVTLGCNAFILASPGTKISDTYWGLKEALLECSPSVVVIETYGIDYFNQYNLSAGNLSDQFKSFSARKNFGTKIQSIPYLFKPDNYLLACSNTLRNHNFIFDNYDQIDQNINLIKERNKKRANTKKEELYLGRYVRFTSGIQDSVLQLYSKKGAPVEGESYSYSEDAEYYVDKIVDLCEKNDIGLVFLTLPMFEKHIDKYEVWQSRLSELLDKSKKSSWLNMQDSNSYSSIGFNKQSFENTYSSNQHMTYAGSLLATYSLAGYLRDSVQFDLPDRTSDSQWHTIFYGQEGYFEHYSPREGDEKRKVIVKNKKIRNVVLSELVVINNEKYKSILLKIPKSNSLNTEPRSRIRLLLDFTVNNKQQRSYIELRPDKFHLPKDFMIYTQNIKGSIDIKNIVDVSFM